jgi:hypothetical protein
VYTGKSNTFTANSTNTTKATLAGVKKERKYEAEMGRD